MIAQDLMDALIESGWLIIKRGFDETYFRSWAQNTRSCLNALLGRDTGKECNKNEE